MYSHTLTKAQKLIGISLDGIANDIFLRITVYGSILHIYVRVRRLLERQTE